MRNEISITTLFIAIVIHTKDIHEASPGKDVEESA